MQCHIVQYVRCLLSWPLQGLGGCIITLALVFLCWGHQYGRFWRLCCRRRFRQLRRGRSGLVCAGILRFRLHYRGGIVGIFRTSFFAKEIPLFLIGFFNYIRGQFPLYCQGIVIGVRYAESLASDLAVAHGSCRLGCTAHPSQ